MAIRNHELDDPILKAAFGEFLEWGYEKASLRKIAARAGVTVGAIYTRYATKDQLFSGVCQPLLDRIAQAYREIEAAYFGGSMEGLGHSMEVENAAILHLLFDDYDRAKLLLCKSRGSSLEGFFDGIIQRKIQETLEFFQGTPVSEPVLKLIISAQFHMYAQIMEEGYPLEQAKTILTAVMQYHIGGWNRLLEQEEKS